LAKKIPEGLVPSAPPSTLSTPNVFGSYAGYAHVMDGTTELQTGTSLFMPILYL